jgi:hypothetical protein
VFRRRRFQLDRFRVAQPHALVAGWIRLDAVLLENGGQVRPAQAGDITARRSLSLTGSRVGALGAVFTCTATYDWFWQSGWGLHENNFQCNFNTPDYPQTWIDSTSYVHYKNGVFCGFTDTHVYYDRNHAVGYGNGNLVGRWNVRKSGFCSGALSVHNRTERTMN